MKRRIAVVGWALIGLLDGCIPGPRPVPPVQDADADVVVLDARPPVQDVCAAACRVLELYGCEEGQPTPAGHSCAEVCRANTILPAAKVAACRDLACVRGAGVGCRLGQ